MSADTAGDTTGASVDGSESVVVGKGNHQQVVNLHADDEHVETIKLVYELVSRLSGKIDQEQADRVRDMAEARRDLDVLRKMVEDTHNQVYFLGSQVSAVAAHFPKTIVLSDRHRWTFAAAFAFLFAPVPLFYSQVREHMDIGWPAALIFALMAYLASAILWAYMWWGK